MSNTRDNIEDYASSRERLILGIHKTADVLKPTYGNAGGNIAIESDLYPGHRVVNDGKVITDSIFFSDSVEQMGANMLKEACDKQEKESGDGRKTAVILTDAILKEGATFPDVAPLTIKKELDACMETVLKQLDKQSKEIPLKSIEKVALIASESEEISKLIGSAYQEIGRQGIIEVESANMPESYYDVVHGMRLHGAKMYAGWQTSPDMCEVRDAHIIVVKDKIQSVSQIEGIYKKLVENRIWEIVLFCDEIDVGVVSRLAISTVAAINGEPNKIKTLIIKAPTLFKDWIYEDISAMTGAVSIDSTKGRTFSNFDVKSMGTCKKWKTTAHESILNGTLDISDHVKKIEESTDERKGMRLGWLTTKVAQLKVGAQTESELSWKIKKSIDAANACRAALQEGVVKGGGQSLLKIRVDSTTIGGKIMSKALLAPHMQILENMGVTDAKFSPDVIDPTLVVKNALRTAVSLAGIILTTKGAITIPEEIKELARKMQQGMR